MISRIPAPPNQRPGHYGRDIPGGYKETLETGINVIQSPYLNEYYKKIKLVVSGELFDRKRLKDIYELIGKYDYLINQYIGSDKYK